MESARKAPSSFLYEALALEYLYRKEYVQAGNMVSTALSSAPDARDHSRLLLESLLVDRARGGNKACLLQMDSVQARMPSADFLPALEEWRRRVTPPPPAPVKK